MSDGIGLAEALLGLDGFRVLDVVEGEAEVVVTIETTVELVGCASCGNVRRGAGPGAHRGSGFGRSGRPARLVWVKRRWRCRERDCPARTWTERCEHLDAAGGVDPSGRRGGVSSGRSASPPGGRSREEFGVCWWTVMNVVIEHGTPLVVDPRRVGRVGSSG